MAGIERRGDRLPRRRREQQAYRLALAGAGTGALGVVLLVLAVAGVIGALAPIALLITSAGCAWRFLRVTGQR